MTVPQGIKNWIPPGSIIGMLGGGQLGRMTALAAARLGYKTHVFTPEPNGPCAQACAAETVADWDDEEALASFADSVDVITLEFENVPAPALELLAALKPTRPGARVLAITQDRVAEKSFANQLGIGTAPWRAADDAAGIAEAVRLLGPSIAKTRRFGYDGKGQAVIADPDHAETAFAAIGRAPAIVEGRVDFVAEISVVLARGLDGQIVSYPAVENHHTGGILSSTIAPARVSPAIAAEADRVARLLAQALDYVGVLAVELFVTRSGDVLMNEMAPRPHNSGHWTIDACAVSQFEQQVRAVCGLPLGPTERFADAEMENLIGDQVDRWPVLIADPGARLHLYGKLETRPGRKMGHVTRLLARTSQQG
jgi:5-(carboxyamino)imidazole ribonucleotide synthase